MIIPELGLLSLVIAFCMACLLAASPILSLNNRALVLGQSAFVLMGFLTLGFCFLQNDFSVEYVALNSNTKLPFMYKLCAIWGAHEGSLLLWVMMLCLWMVMAMRESRVVSAILGAISAGLLFLILNTSNPFARLLPSMPLEGVDLNPLLQDPGFVIHPPFLYMGYVGFAIPFAFSMAALIKGEQDDLTWVKWARPFALMAWSFLTVGIVLGSWWAYYELGWGGWWFWDPVENASLMPWLLGGALCHSLIICNEKKRFLPWTHLLAIGTFVLSLMGTFLVRSGIISSVHAFATDPKRGTFILAFIVIVLVFSFAVYVWRYSKPNKMEAVNFNSKEMGLLIGNLILVVMCLTVLLGTLYPLAMEVLFQKRLSVGPPYFHTMMVYLMTPMFLFMSFVPSLQWGKDTGSDLFKRLKKPLIGFLALTSLGLIGSVLLNAFAWYECGALMLVSWLIIATLYRQVMIKDKKRTWGMFFAHIGMGIALIGMVLVNSLEVESEVRVKVGESIGVGKKEFIFYDIQPHQGANFEGQKGHFIIKDNGKIIARLFPEKRYFPARESVMTETAIKPGFFEDYYIALGEPFQDGSWSARIYIKPFIRWIWLGGLLVALGAMLSSLTYFQPFRGKNVS